MSLWSSLNQRSTSTLVVVAVAIVFIGLIAYQNGAGSTSAFEQKIMQAREQRDLFLKNSPESPIPREQKPDFQGLSYFPPTAAFITEAELELAPRPDTVRMLLSNGQSESMIALGTLRFALQRREYQLTAFRPASAPAGSDLFVPFTDLSSGTLTYGGGRYLNVPAQKPIRLDFNLAYHPDCLHNDSYACPIPPASNRLNIEIAAGERLPEQKP